MKGFGGAISDDDDDGMEKDEDAAWRRVGRERASAAPASAMKSVCEERERGKILWFCLDKNWSFYLFNL